jgi:DNA-binding beta-propeller fold protein YncE
LAEFKAQETPLRYPGKLLADAASDRLFIADSNHNRIVITRLDGTLLDTIGNGQEGRADGDYTLAEFHHPQGLALNGETLYVADTENHSLRKIDLQSRRVKTIAGRGAQARHNWPGVNIEDGRPASSANLPKRYVSKPSVTALNSPWDLWIHGHDLYIAMAGPHQIWKMPLDESEIGPYAGNGREDIVDGPLLPHIPYQEGFASFAQPSGLTADDRWLYVADSEGSSIRAVPFDPKKKVHTIIGTAGLSSNRLFTFGDVDGRSGSVRLQHALGVAYHDGLLYVADTYNNKVKVIDPKELTSNTLAGSGQAGRDDGPSGEPLTATFDEPAGISIAGETIYLADTNSHAIRTIDLAHGNRVGTLNIPGLSPPKRVEKEPTLTASKIHKVATATVRPEAGQVTLHISLHLPEGWKINPLAPMQYRVEALDKTLFEKNALGQSVKLSEPKTEFDINLPVTASAGHDRLRVTLQYFYCQEAAVGLCKAGSVMWELPITVSADATTSQTSLTWKVD